MTGRETEDETRDDGNTSKILQGGEDIKRMIDHDVLLV